MIEVGHKAPAFRLHDERGEWVSLSDLLGKWVVLYFYPEDDTPGCTVQACEFTAGIRAFEKIGSIVHGCSPDSPLRHRQFVAKHRLRVSLLSDPTHTTMEKYGAWGEKNLYGKTVAGVIRSTVIVDPSGNVAHHWKRVSSAGHAESVRKKLVELQACVKC